MDYSFQSSTGRFVAPTFGEVQSRKATYENKTVGFNASDISPVAGGGSSGGEAIKPIVISDMADGSNNTFTDGSGNDFVFITQ